MIIYSHITQIISGTQQLLLKWINGSFITTWCQSNQ